jgi:cyclopropane fatty-acyl-phospholipid synthase-like methyltransferase
MKAQDNTTLAFYAEQAQAYTSRGQDAAAHVLDIFLERLPPGASVLELGCGAGQDSEFMIARGFDVTPTDGTAEIAQAAERRLGRPVGVLLFGDIDVRERFDGVWANACLLHVPRAELPGIIARIRAALKPGGVFYASFKAGEAEGRDTFDRYYNYPSAEWLRQAYDPELWQEIEITQAIGSGYDKKPTDWLHVTARKAAG